MQHLQPNTTLQGGKYKIEKLLGQGGFGITYLAEQSLLKIKVAIKEFFIRDLCDRDDTANVHTITQADMVDRYRQKFFKEAQILARLRHPGIVQVTDIFEENGTAYYVMEYVEGESLADIIKRNGPLSEEKAMSYISKVADALDYIHQSKVNHLDLKPANIMIRRDDDEPVIIDFGVSKQYDEQKDQTTTTPPGVSNGYSPLEQYKPGGVSTFSPQADIYALGATLYKLLTGNTPPNASDMLNDGLPSMPSSVSSNVRKVIEKAMQPRRDDRPESIRVWKQMLTATTDSEETVLDQPIAPAGNEETQIIDPVGVEVEPFEEENSFFSRYRFGIPLAVVLLACLGIFLYLKSNEPDDKTITAGMKMDKKSDVSKTDTDNEPQSNNDLRSLLVDKIAQWDMGHELGETYRLFSLYANRVYFYGEMCSRETIIEKIDELLNKQDGFTQSSSNIDITQLSNTSVRCNFDKHTFHADGRKGNYPSYLRFEKIDGDWLIVEESDAITDKNLRKRNTSSNYSPSISQTNHLNLKGSFYNQKGSWPVEFVIQIDNDGQINGVYKNISQKVNLKVVGQMYSDGSMEINDRNGNLYVNLNKTNTREYRGEATSGQTTLQVMLEE